MGEGVVVGEKQHPTPENPSKRHILPTHFHNGKLKTKGIQQDGESGRSGFHPLHFFYVTWYSSNEVSKWLNIFWPFVPAGIAAHFALKDHHATVFALTYLGVIAPANLLGSAGQELARKLPRVLGILLETALGSVVEIILFMVLAVRSAHSVEYIAVLQAAILGSIMTNLLLCLGFCFFVGGLKNKGEQKFHDVISETGSGIILVAAFALLIPSAFYTSISGLTTTQESKYPLQTLLQDTRSISHYTSIILIVTYIIYLIYHGFSAHSIFDDVLLQDEEMDADRHRDLAKRKYTLTEAIIGILIATACVTLLVIFLVEEIRYIVEEKGVPDAFVGFILVPLVEKLAEHVTAVDEAYDNQINFALYHCIGPSIQTALFNAPLAVIVSWGLGSCADLNFKIFMIVILVFSVLVVGNFLRDGSSNWLEGALLIIVYIIIAVATWYYPNEALRVEECVI